MINQSIVRLIVKSEVPGKYWSKNGGDTNDLMQAVMYIDKSQIPPAVYNKTIQIRIDIKELPWEVTGER